MKNTTSNTPVFFKAGLIGANSVALILLAMSSLISVYLLLIGTAGVHPFDFLVEKYPELFSKYSRIFLITAVYFLIVVGGGELFFRIISYLDHRSMVAFYENPKNENHIYPLCGLNLLSKYSTTYGNNSLLFLRVCVKRFFSLAVCVYLLCCFVLCFEFRHLKLIEYFLTFAVIYCVVFLKNSDSISSFWYSLNTFLGDVSSVMDYFRKNVYGVNFYLELSRMALVSVVMATVYCLIRKQAIDPTFILECFCPIFIAFVAFHIAIIPILTEYQENKQVV